jgi:hypothetical protein
VSLDPERRHVADDERRGGAGLDELVGQDHLLHDSAGDGARIANFGRMATFWRSSSERSCSVTKILRAWSDVCTSVAASL